MFCLSMCRCVGMCDTCVSMGLCTYVCTWLCICRCACVCMDVFVHACAHVYQLRHGCVLALAKEERVEQGIGGIPLFWNVKGKEWQDDEGGAGSRRALNDTPRRLALGFLSSDSLDDIQGVMCMMGTGQDQWFRVCLEKLESPEAEPETGIQEPVLRRSHSRLTEEMCRMQQGRCWQDCGLHWMPASAWF